MRRRGKAAEGIGYPRTRLIVRICGSKNSSGFIVYSIGPDFTVDGEPEPRGAKDFDVTTLCFLWSVRNRSVDLKKLALRTPAARFPEAVGCHEHL